MKQLWSSVLAAVAIGIAVPAAAQTPGATGEWAVGVNTGVAVVDKATGVVAGEVSRRVSDNLDLLAEGVWLANGASHQQRNGVGSLADYLARTQGQDASGSVDVHVFYVGAGVRWLVGSLGRLQPYGIVTGGLAHTKPNATFMLGGADVTGSIGDYGIGLGKDLSGSSNSGAVSAGLGVLAGSGPLYFDIGARWMNIGGSSARVNVGRFVIGGGYRF
jgi:hypothetical protein